jgi:hypothetical protein
MDKTQIFKNAGLALSEKPMFVRNGSKAEMPSDPRRGPLLRVEPKESARKLTSEF